MNTEKDYEDLLRLFNKHKVRYCIVGAYAIAFHSRPRYTKDIDVFVEPSLANGRQIVKALRDFGFASLKLGASDFAKEGKIVQLGYEPLRIDLITSIDGIPFAKAWKSRCLGKYGRVRVPFIGKKALVQNKRASGRKQDLADLENLQ